MPFTEMIGFLAAGLVLATFVMRTMLPLRILGISSNIAFMTYGWLQDLPPVLLLHALLLPINLYRLFEMRQLIRVLQDASLAAADLSWLLPYTRRVACKAGDVLFRKDDRADAMYLVEAGRIRLDELDIAVGPREVLGEIGVFAPQGRRTATATCLESCRLRKITRETVQRLVLQSPQFAYYLIGVAIERLVDDLHKAEDRLAVLSAQRLGAGDGLQAAGPPRRTPSPGP
jgi:CRP/FNR family transcriptional regulator, cyclic AMP receptor protein